MYMRYIFSSCAMRIYLSAAQSPAPSLARRPAACLGRQPSPPGQASSPAAAPAHWPSPPGQAPATFAPPSSPARQHRPLTQPTRIAPNSAAAPPPREALQAPASFPYPYTYVFIINIYILYDKYTCICTYKIYVRKYIDYTVKYVRISNYL